MVEHNHQLSIKRLCNAASAANLADGASEAAAISALQAEWAALWDQIGAKIAANINGGD